MFFDNLACDAPAPRRVAQAGAASPPAPVTNSKHHAERDEYVTILDHTVLDQTLKHWLKGDVYGQRMSEPLAGDDLDFGPHRAGPHGQKPGHAAGGYSQLSLDSKPPFT